MRKLTILVATAMMLASSGVAWATPGGEHGQGAAYTTLIPQAQFGIATAISHNFSGGCGSACE